MKKNRTPMVTPGDALNLILTHITPLDAEAVPLLGAAGRVLAEKIVSGMNIPPFDNSAMDGYALVAASTRGASKDQPARLFVTGEIKAGDAPCALPASGSAMRIMTGAPVPSGCDAVVPVEDTSEKDGNVLIHIEARPGDHIRRAGEDIPSGSTVLRAGRRITPADAGLMASLDFTLVPVRKQPRVGIISTGNEIVDPGEPLREGQIRNSNASTLHGEILKCGALPHYLGIARDTEDDTRRIIAGAEKCDVIITTGGVSMGLYDFVPGVLRELGIELIFETIRMKPGKPCVFGALGSRLYFGLPGNPVSTMVSFIQFVRPALLALMGAELLAKPLVSAVLDEPIKKKKGRAHYIRGFFTLKKGMFHVTSTGPQGSGMLRSMSDANCLIILPEETEKAAAGDAVTIQLIHHDEVS
jgi:molybdopterin molybdotransferase